MNTKDTSNKAESKALLPNSTIWLWLSIVAAIVAIAGNILALSINRIYASLTPVFLPQAVAQDIANLALIAPLWLILAALALRGSVRAYLLWLGVLTFTVYNYVIYTFSIPFEVLFLLWVAVFGMSLFALIGGAVSMDYQAVASAFTSRRAVQVTAWFLIVTAVLFGFLWLSEDVPALLSNTKPQSVVDMAIPTNPVHILDLGFFLPAVIITGMGQDGLRGCEAVRRALGGRQRDRDRGDRSTDLAVVRHGRPRLRAALDLRCDVHAGPHAARARNAARTGQERAGGAVRP